MDNRRLVVIHSNPNIEHQVTYAKALQLGFRGLGFNALVTADRSLRGEINIIDGPNWAYKDLLGEPNVLMLDRAWWGDPHYVSLGWLQADGSREFCAGVDPSRWGEMGPRLQAPKKRGLVGMLLDYDMNPPYWADNVADAIRWHPARIAGQEPLTTFLRRCRKVIAWRSTAVAEALFAGCELWLRDSRNPLYGMSDRQDMAAKLANSQWSLQEIADGKFWPQLSAGVTEGWPVGSLASGGDDHETVSRNGADD